MLLHSCRSLRFMSTTIYNPPFYGKSVSTASRTRSISPPTLAFAFSPTGLLFPSGFLTHYSLSSTTKNHLLGSLNHSSRFFHLPSHSYQSNNHLLSTAPSFPSHLASSSSSSSSSSSPSSASSTQSSSSINLNESFSSPSSDTLRTVRGDAVPNIEEHFDVIVVGAGHAGCEAAIAACNLGRKTLLLTLNIDRIAWQPCNPAVGGPAKSTLVHEVDALGGIIGKVADRTYLQKRVLNRSKGPAVWALRAQTDKREYSKEMIRVLDQFTQGQLSHASASASPEAGLGQGRLTIREGMVVDLTLDPLTRAITGVTTHFGATFSAPAVVLTTGTFLEGLIWCGAKSIPAGRAGEMPAIGLSDTLRTCGFTTGRLKTGTPARVDSRSVDYSQMIPQDSEYAEQERWFSFDQAEWVHRDTMLCYLTRTTPETHQLIRDNLHLTPKYGGFMDSKGPRYCPSIEDKIVRFADKETHQIFIEPEGRTIPELYIQGFSTGMPEHIQKKMLQTLPGLQNCRMVRPAYAVDYDYLPATQLYHTMMTKQIDGLFLAGQVCGTTGYEEAAAQGYVAGVNAAKFAAGHSMVTFSREDSYIGTLIDDLCTKELLEPYRVLTSRSEYRLVLRGDNADKRLTPLGRQIGTVSDHRWKLYNDKMDRFQKELTRLKNSRVKEDGSPQAKQIQDISGPIKGSSTLFEILRRPQITYSHLDQLDLGAADLHLIEKEGIEIQVKYQGYLKRMQDEIKKQKYANEKPIDPEIDFHQISTLRTEAREKLSKARPKTIGEAAKLGGVNPADIASLLIHMSKLRKEEARKNKDIHYTQERKHPSSAAVEN